MRVNHVVLAALIGLAGARAADAAVTVTIRQAGTNVVVEGNGTLDTSTLLPGVQSSIVGNLYPEYAGLTISPIGFPPTFLASYGGITGPADFGTGSLTLASAHAGDAFGLSGFGRSLFVPLGYVSGTPLAGTSTYFGATIASLGLRPGTYVYSWGGRIAAETLTIDVRAAVPEPAQWATMIAGIGLSAGLLRARRRRRVAAP